MSFRSARIAGVALGLVLMAAPAASQTPLPAVPTEDPLDKRDAKRVERMEKVVRELRAIVFQLRDSGKPVVVQPADTDTRLQDLVNRVSDLEQSLRRLNGALETTTHDLDQARRDNAALQTQVKALEGRIAATEQAAAPAPAAEPGPAPAAAASQPSAADAFANARRLMLAGEYDAAQAAFADYVATYPDSPKAPEAHYWLGKTLAVRGAHAQAATAYIGAIRGWPQTGWAPDAVVELARSLIALKKPADACQALGELSRRYPKAPAAVAARGAKARADAKCS